MIGVSFWPHFCIACARLNAGRAKEIARSALVNSYAFIYMR